MKIKALLFVLVLGVSQASALSDRQEGILLGVVSGIVISNVYNHHNEHYYVRAHNKKHHYYKKAIKKSHRHFADNNYRRYYNEPKYRGRYKACHYRH